MASANTIFTLLAQQQMREQAAHEQRMAEERGMEREDEQLAWQRAEKEMDRAQAAKDQAFQRQLKIAELQGKSAETLGKPAPKYDIPALQEMAQAGAVGQEARTYEAEQQAASKKAMKEREILSGIHEKAIGTESYVLDPSLEAQYGIRHLGRRPPGQTGRRGVGLTPNQQASTNTRIANELLGELSARAGNLENWAQFGSAQEIRAYVKTVWADFAQFGGQKSIYEILSARATQGDRRALEILERTQSQQTGTAPSGPTGLPETAPALPSSTGAAPQTAAERAKAMRREALLGK
jgi:hypothetical protein